MWMFNLVLSRLSILAFSSLVVSALLSPATQAQKAQPRSIVVNVKDSTGSVDRAFDLSVGSDYPGTLIRDDSQAQLKLVTDELGFRYVRILATCFLCCVPN
jgi:xylan 1,4-beta-xylosidase